jgi:hypothetical protein
MSKRKLFDQLANDPGDTQPTINCVTLKNLMEILEKIRRHYGGDGDDVFVAMYVAPGSNPHSLEYIHNGTNRQTGQKWVHLSETQWEKEDVGRDPAGRG